MRRILTHGSMGQTIVGGPEAEVLSGTIGGDTIHGHQVLVSGSTQAYEGNFILAWGGDDLIQAGFGSDTVLAGDGNDVVYGGGIYGGTGRGGPSLAAADGADVILGGLGRDQIFGAGGADLILGEDGADALFGEWGRDTLIGGAGADTLVGGLDADQMEGGTGLDVFVVGFGNVPYAGNSFRPETAAGPGARDVITDFEVGIDKILLTAAAPPGQPPSFFVYFEGGNTILNFEGRNPYTGPYDPRYNYRAEIELVGFRAISLVDLLIA